MRATSLSWNHLEPPEERESLEFEALFTDEEADRLMCGLIPEQMEDKWFVYYEDGWLRFHRSWTGVFVYGLRLDGSPAGVRVTESWVNRNQQHYAANDADYDRKVVRFLIDAVMLKKPGVAFPMPTGARDVPKGVVQHSLVGRAHPELDEGKHAEGKPWWRFWT